METVILAEDYERERIIEIINKAIEGSELPVYKPWPIKSEDGGEKKKKPRKEIDLTDGKKKKKQESQDMLLMQMIQNKNKQADAFAGICDKYTKLGAGGGGSSGKGKGRGKGKKATEYDLDDDSFEKFQQKMMEERKK
jgi:hypothetical protein